MGLYNQNSVVDMSTFISNFIPRIEDADLISLSRGIDLIEVKESLFRIVGLKALEWMASLLASIKTQWSKCALDLLNLVTTSFSEGSALDNLNSTLITLVPKIESPESMVHFRPISLCSTLYKVISKVLVARLRPILPNLTKLVMCLGDI